jgi:hypothetical protein
VSDNVTKKNESGSIEEQQERPQGSSRNVIFRRWECRLEFRKYFDGHTAIMLVDANNGGEVAMATVNVPEVQLKANQILIKDYSENAGMLDALSEAGIVKPTGEFVHFGFVAIPVCDLLVQPHQEVSEHIDKEEEQDHEITR